MNKIGIAALATAVISSAALANDGIVGEIVLGKNNFIGTGLKLPKLDKAQTTLYSTDWSNFTVGSAVGQDLWTKYPSSVASSNFAITATRPGGQAGKGYNQTHSGTVSRYFYRDLSTAFAGRGAGENIVWTESSLYNKAANTQRGTASMFTFDTLAANITSGLQMDIGSATTLSTVQGRIKGAAYLTLSAAQAVGATAAGNYVFTLNTGTLTAPVPTAGSWVYFASNRNLNTGVVEWYYSVDGGVSYTGFAINAGVRAIDDLEFDYVTYSPSATTAGNFNVDFGNLAVYTVPAPGAAALVGLAGLVSRRRR